MKKIIGQPLVLILFGAIVAAGAIAALFLPIPVMVISEALLLMVAILVVVNFYRAGKIEDSASVERSELKGILSGLGDALLVYDTNFRVLFFGAAAEELFKLKASAVVGTVLAAKNIEKEELRKLTQVIFPSLAPKVVPRSKEGVFPQVSDISFTDPEVDLRVTTMPLVDEKGETMAFMKIIRDRTAQIDAIRSRTEFVTVISHQLRTPVTEINWALEALTGVQGIDETNKQIILNARASAASLLRRIEDLINIAKMEDGQFGYAFAEADIVEFVGKVLADVLPSARQAGIKIYFDRPTGVLPHVMIDEKRLSLVLVNLLENAIRYNIENGEVVVKIDKAPNKPFIEVSVRDTGIGIPADAAAKIFTKFFRAENAVKAQADGSGLGLYIAKSIVEAHGGQISTASEENRGTVVTFTIPIDPNLVPKHEVGVEDLF